jgi:hypothetical protein
MFPRFPKAFESKEEHHSGEHYNQQESSGSYFGRVHISSIFLNRGQYEDDTQCQEDPANDFQPELA